VKLGNAMAAALLSLVLVGCAQDLLQPVMTGAGAPVAVEEPSWPGSAPAGSPPAATQGAGDVRRGRPTSAGDPESERTGGDQPVGEGSSTPRRPARPPAPSGGHRRARPASPVGSPEGTAARRGRRDGPGLLRPHLQQGPADGLDRDGRHGPLRDRAWPLASSSPQGRQPMAAVLRRLLGAQPGRGPRRRRRGTPVAGARSG
jgi:hypothetical protein